MHGQKRDNLTRKKEKESTLKVGLSSTNTTRLEFNIND